MNSNASADLFLDELPKGLWRSTSLTRYSTKGIPNPVFFNMILDFSKTRAKICLIDLHHELGGDAIRDRLVDVLRHQVFGIAQNHKPIHPAACDFYVYEAASQWLAHANVRWHGPFWFPALLKGRLSGTYDFLGWEDVPILPELVRSSASPDAFSTIPKEWRPVTGVADA